MAIPKELISDLSALPGTLHEQRVFNAYLFCNETRYSQIVPTLDEQRRKAPGGIGLAIGSGGVFSLLPSLQLDALLVVDINRAVIEFTQTVGKSINNSNSPDEAKTQLFSLDYNPDILTEIQKNRVSLEHLQKVQLANEAESFDRFHWSDRERFLEVQRSLKKTDIIYLTTDITSPYFTKRLIDIFNIHGAIITYANFSNLHEWTRNMDFIRNWPTHPSITMQYATHEGMDLTYPSFPYVQISDSIEEYLKRITVDYR